MLGADNMIELQQLNIGKWVVFGLRRLSGIEATLLLSQRGK